jgi:hypothetical protein
MYIGRQACLSRAMNVVLEYRVGFSVHIRFSVTDKISTLYIPLLCCFLWINLNDSEGEKRG